MRRTTTKNYKKVKPDNQRQLSWIVRIVKEQCGQTRNSSPNDKQYKNINDVHDEQ